MPPTVAERADLLVGDVASEPLRARGLGLSTSAATGVIAPITTRSPSTRDGVEPAAVEHQRAARGQPACGDLRQQDRAAAEHCQAVASAEQQGRLVGGRREENLGGHALDSKRGESQTARIADSFESIDELESGLAQASYLTDRGLATALYLALTLEKPLLLEGEAGVGKTEAAKAVAAALDAPLIRLQCYEGLDVAHAVYEWNYARQLLHIRAAQEGTVDEAELFGREFLIRRPVLEALESERRSVLLIDEIDRADEEFEAFLLEVLSDFQVTIPELGTIHATSEPVRDPDVEPDPRAA